MPGSVGKLSLAGDDASLGQEAALRCFRFVKIAQSVSPTFQTKGNQFPSGVGPHTAQKKSPSLSEGLSTTMKIVLSII
jgi:hypothetical protein